MKYLISADAELLSVLNRRTRARIPEIQCNHALPAATSVIRSPRYYGNFFLAARQNLAVLTVGRIAGGGQGQIS